MLTVTLKALERDGLLTRTAYAEVPPRVEYDLTPLGRSLLDAVMTLAGWAASHLVGTGKVVAGAEGVGVVGPEDSLPVAEELLEQGDRLGDPAGLLVGVGEVVAGSEGVGMVGSEVFLAVAEGQV